MAGPMVQGIIPRERGRLVEIFGVLLGEILAERSADVRPEVAAYWLEKHGFFQGFDPLKHLPKMLTDTETAALLGCQWHAWEMWCWDNVGVSCSPNTHRKTRKVLSLLRSGTIESTEEPRYPDETVAKFTEYLRASVDRMLNKMIKHANNKTAATPKAVMRPGWLLGVPEDYDTFYREYRPYVEKVLNRYNKAGYDPEMIKDLKQFTWTKLIESQLLEKFVAKAKRRKLPKQLSAMAAVEYLGITWDEWLGLMRANHPWLQPISGGAFTASAEFTDAQIRNVEESGLFPIRDAIPTADMTKVFRGYLQRAIHHHFANWLRTRSRRHKERPVPLGCRIVDNQLASSYEDDDTSWEQGLVDKDPVSPESKADLLSAVVGGDVHGYLTATVERINEAVPGRQNDVFDLIAKGYTLNEAILAVRAKVRAKSRVRTG